MRVCECESVIVTWLIHHGQSPFDYKRRGPVINRWIQLPGRSCDTRSQSICTGTPPLAPLPCSSVPPYRPHPYTHTHTCTKYPPPAFPSLPAQLSVTFCPCLAFNNTHLTLSFSSSSALPPLYSSDFCFILAQTLPLGSPSPPSPVPRISCPYHFALPTSALSHPVPIIFPFQTILCNPQLEIHQSITVVILSPFALPFSPCPTSYDPSIFSFIYQTH